MYKKRFFLIVFCIFFTFFGFFYLGKNHFLQIDLSSLKNLKDIVPVAIIGSGPAGASAAIFSARGLTHTVVFQGPYPGGQLTRTTKVENWPGTPSASGSEIIETIKKQAQHFGAIFSNDTISKVDFKSWPFKLWTDAGKQINALSVIIATGGTSKKLNIPGEQKYFGKGVATCGICDAAFHKGQDVVVVGSSDAALQEAALLAKFAKKVTVIAGKETGQATAFIKEQIKDIPNIEILLNTIVTKILGDETHAKQIEIQDLNTKDKKLMDVGAVFIGIGQTPNTEIFKDHIALSKKGYINVICNTQNTSAEGVYAAGSAVHKKFTKAISAAGDAVKAAITAMDFLENLKVNNFINEHDDRLYRPTTNEIERLGHEKEFVEKVEKNQKPSVVLYYSSTCPDCSYMLSVLDQLSMQYNDKFNFYKIERNNIPSIEKKYNIEQIPYLQIIKNGKEEHHIVGHITKNEFEKLLES